MESSIIPFKNNLVIKFFLLTLILALSSGVVGAQTYNPYPNPTPIDNPELENSCGLDMVLIIDSSGSIDNTELTQMKNAFKGFVDAFLPNTPTEIAVVEFDETASLTQGYTNNALNVKNAVDSAVSDGCTNWEGALEKAHSQFNNRLDKPDLYVFASDGNPNTIIGGRACGSYESTAVAKAVEKANEIKSDGVRIITLGIGDYLSPSNLIAISSLDAYHDSDFDTLADDLADIAEELCGGTITVKKLIDGQPAENWEFSADVANGIPNPSSDLTDNDGFVNFKINIANNNAEVDITETLQTDYILDSAACWENAIEVGTFDGLGSVDNIVVDKNDIIYCEFNNRLKTFCGDGNIQSPNDDGEFEECDDNNNNDNDGCDAQCKIEIPQPPLDVPPSVSIEPPECQLCQCTKNVGEKLSVTVFASDDHGVEQLLLGVYGEQPNHLDYYYDCGGATSCSHIWDITLDYAGIDPSSGDWTFWAIAKDTADQWSDWKVICANVVMATLTPPCDSYGDLNNDGYVTTADITLVESCILNPSQCTQEQKSRADIDDNGIVDGGDVVIIEQYITGVTDTFPVCQVVEGCITNADCNDGLFCNGQETCNQYTRTCQTGTPIVCNDGLFCNGIETCNEATDSCYSGIPVVCSNGNFCNEAINSCELIKHKKESDRRNIVHINLIAFGNEFVRPGDELHIYINFENKADFDLKDARITAIIRELGVRSNTIKSSVVGKNEESSKQLILEIPKYAKPGRYWIEIVIDIDGDRRIKYRPIDIV